MQPFISFVVTARNDNYGGHWVNRINAFLKVLAYQAERTKLPAEVVFTEYNPVPGKPNLYQELSVPKNSYFEVRFVLVPNEFHKTLPDNEKVSVCEFIGKNIAARRARGEYIVGTNPDVLYSNELFDFFASQKMEKNAFYRINRKDLSTGFIEPTLTAEKILENAEKKVTKIMYNSKTAYISFPFWLNTFIHGRTLGLFLQCPFFNAFRKFETDNSIIHENAAGDFLLMHKTLWEKVRGYDQVTVGSGVMDGYIMYSLYCLGFRQVILPYFLYHINHHHGGVRYLASHKKFREDANRMLETKVPYKINSENWGFPDKRFEEIIKSQ